MGLIDSFLDLVAPPTALITLFLFLPPFYLYKLILSFLSSFFPEDMTKKVVLVTGASSGIGEHLAYQYAKRGAYLVLVARREKSLAEVGERAKQLGSPEVIVFPADVSVYEECRQFINATISYFGRLDHLVMAAGVEHICLFDEAIVVTRFRTVMDINYWGSVYPAYFAIPHLRKTHGRIVVIVSSATYLPFPRLSFYNASKAALLNFYETLRIEIGSEVGITTVNPGVVESEFTKGKHLNKEGKMEVNPEIRDELVWLTPVEKTEDCTKAIVDGACRGARHVTEPAWYRSAYMMRIFAPEVLGWSLRMMYISPRIAALTKGLLDFPGVRSILHPSSIHSPEIKQG